MTKWILGVRPTLTGLVIDPSIPADWDGFTVTRQWRGATYRIRVANPAHVCHGVASVLAVILVLLTLTMVLAVDRLGGTGVRRAT